MCVCLYVKRVCIHTQMIIQGKDYYEKGSHLLSYTAMYLHSVAMWIKTLYILAGYVANYLCSYS